jgi:hypothetical protein
MAAVLTKVAFLVDQLSLHGCSPIDRAADRRWWRAVARLQRLQPRCNAGAARFAGDVRLRLWHETWSGIGSSQYFVNQKR